ncbi:MAG: glycerophosphodiester phosphodiesterase [Myxococcota bacterium]
MAAPPAILAHRGASARHPENTVRALVAALRDDPPADGVECDVRLGADGVPIVFHDRDTTRLTGVPGSIEARTLTDVRDLRVDDEPVPTLEQALEATRPLLAARPGGLLNVELKPTGDGRRPVQACRPLLDPLAADPAVRLVVSSFDARVLRAALDDGAPWRLALIYDDPTALGFLEHLGPPGSIDLHADHRLLDAAHLTLLREEYGQEGAALRAWTVDDPARAAALESLGVAAIITNRPQELKEARR